MATAHESCSNCGAKLSAGEIGAVLRCEFCGTENRVEAEIAPPRVEVRMTALRVSRAARPEAPAPRLAAADSSETSTSPSSDNSAAFIGIGAVVVVAIVIAIVVVASKKSGTSTLVPGDLHTASIVWNQDTPLDAPPTATSREHFDPLANIDWAVNIGKAWWPDAELKSISADPIAKDGLVDLTRDGAKVEYDFYSAACMADYTKRVETTPGVPETTCHLVLELGPKTTTVSMALIGRNNLTTIEHPQCRVSQAFAKLTANGTLAPRPTYALALAGRDPIEWTIRAGTGSAPLQTANDLPYDFCRTP